MADHGGLLIYGAYGYTGELTARFARDLRQLKPILAGRSARRVEAVARHYGFESRCFGLDDAQALDAGLAGIKVVLHCAGPFSRTSKPMVDACLRNGTHYLDITGEIDVFEACAARDEEAREAGVMLLPGTGFDVVPSDCLAAHVATKRPGAEQLTLAFAGLGKMSHGTATTVVENLGKTGLVRRGGRIAPTRLGSLTREIDFPVIGRRHAMCIPWGDVSTAYYSTGIPNIECYAMTPPVAAKGALLAGYIPRVVGSSAVKGLLQKRIDRGPAGPSDVEREAGASFLWAEARDGSGRKAEARLVTPEGYTLTALASLEIARRALEGDAALGFQTPAKAYGADLILAFDGVRREDT